MRARRLSAVGVGAVAALAVMSACGSGDNTAAGAGSQEAVTKGAGATTVSVVASTDVWGDVVKQIAGSLAGSTVQITSIITDPDADPHSYEANTQNQLALSKAKLVVENGGGYDDFVDTMLKTADNAGVTKLNAVDISGKTAPKGGDLNEHVWYDFPTVQKVAAQIEQALAKADPANAATYQGNESAFDQKLAAMESTEASIKSAHAGEGVAITEPVPLYMLQACGLDNKTPSEFSEAIEEGTDVSPAVLKQAEDLFNDKQVKLLAYNEQTSGPETEAVLKAAKANDIAVVPVTETLPAGKDYLSWMQSNLAAIQTALG
ncbi:metal ABC transporter solute-binding protein, Zn/Mn family [Nocardioides sp.]|uniref:metal ABC transporter solute-binding protein, Zn/Mn family n=1 Tax=Nocardioides sp. TaxID=35761 RepID=UPI002C1E3B0F|nr:zinc ABC transporter substrate-binding protein [Nocardioides sp.]HVX55299.1 zinc ABC transporter substrate-binding protein [Nocardioides sp.]